MIESKLFWIAQVLSDPATQKLVDELAQKDFKWWFGAVFALLIASGSYVFKLQQNQLSEQRKENTELTKQLINYIKEDRAAGLVLMKEVAESLKQVSTALIRLDDNNNITSRK